MTGLPCSVGTIDLLVNLCLFMWHSTPHTAIANQTRLSYATAVHLLWYATAVHQPMGDEIYSPVNQSEVRS